MKVTAATVAVTVAGKAVSAHAGYKPAPSTTTVPVYRPRAHSKNLFPAREGTRPSPRETCTEEQLDSGMATWNNPELYDQGPVFGVATLVFDPSRGRQQPWSQIPRPQFQWTPSKCEECGGFKDHWVNYNYRCCLSCWNVISSQLWSFLLDSVHDHPARVVWAFLLEPFQHGGVRRRFCLDRGWVRY